MREGEPISGKPAAPSHDWVIGSTFVVMVVSPIIIVVTAALVGSLMAFVKKLFTGEITGFVQLGAALAGGVVGVFAAHSAADAWVAKYHSRVVFGSLAILGMSSLIYENINYPFNFAGVVSQGQVIAELVTAYFLFWAVSVPGQSAVK